MNSDANRYNYEAIQRRKLKESICVAATVKVLKFDDKKMTVDVQPLSKHLENGKYETQPPILKVPVALTHCGRFIFRPWFEPGDVGVVLYLDHDMDSTVSGGKEAIPLTERNHATSDAVFVGALVAGSYEDPIDKLPEKSIALATEDGIIFAAVTKDKIIIKNTDTTEAEFFAEKINLKTKDLKIDASGTIEVKAGSTATYKSGDDTTIQGKNIYLNE
ncbi:MAG: Gp138 family membrane-puncturing spike protein [Oscillospiraceae bacterium]|nr:Gp138 family membrane-puncturing spike protein [Oscillospiraceae bacterium]